MQELGRGLARGARWVSPPQGGPTGSASPIVSELGATLPLLPGALLPRGFVGASRSAGGLPGLEEGKPPNRGQCAAPTLGYCSARLHVQPWAESMLLGQRSRLPPPQPEQAAPQQAPRPPPRCRCRCRATSWAHTPWPLTRSSQGGILQGDEVRLSPGLLPVNEPVNKALKPALGGPARRFASLNLSLLICEMDNKGSYHALS